MNEKQSTYAKSMTLALNEITCSHVRQSNLDLVNIASFQMWIAQRETHYTWRSDARASNYHYDIHYTVCTQWNIPDETYYR